MSAINPAQFGEQQRLFDPKSTRPQDPGEQSFDQWLEHPNTAYHGSFREDWEAAPHAHYGDLGTASFRVHNVADLMRYGKPEGEVGQPRVSPEQYRQSYYSGETPPDDGWDLDYDEDPEPQTHVGRVYARRLDVAGRERDRRKGEYSDTTANTAQYHQLRKQGYESWEVPGPTTEATDNRVISDWRWAEGTDEEPTLLTPKGAGKASRALERGRAISYQNEVEKGSETGDTNVSFVAPRKAVSSWEGDVMASPHASPLAKQMATRRMSAGMEGAVPFRAKGMADAVDQTILPGFHTAGQRKGYGWGQMTVSGPRMLNKVQFDTLDTVE